MARVSLVRRKHFVRLALLSSSSAPEHSAVGLPPISFRGARVTLLDAWGPGNSRASSGGETRSIRASYGPAHAIYVNIVVGALQLWQEYERQWNVKLFFRSGELHMAGAFGQVYLRGMMGVGDLLRGRMLLSLAADDFDGVCWAVYELESGFLAARRACEAVLNAFLRQAGEYRQARVTPGPIASNRMDGVILNQADSLKADNLCFRARAVAWQSISVFSTGHYADSSGVLLFWYSWWRSALRGGALANVDGWWQATILWCPRKSLARL